MSHTFHIPVLGLGFSIDTPLKVARFGISSVVSIVDDELVERMRKYHLEENGLEYVPIQKNEEDHRARRITAYLNVLNQLVMVQFDKLKQESFEPSNEIVKYFELLPETSLLKEYYYEMLSADDPEKKRRMQDMLRLLMRPGRIDVNIMSKVDKMNVNKNGELLPEIYSDAMSALRGFANSDLKSSLILSAGMNPRLYGYLSSFDDFFPGESGLARKDVILKVSDFRSALIQAKFLAKKGIWVSEFRVESGLNCGGHAFATEGHLLGPILEEFRQNRKAMFVELLELYLDGLKTKGIDPTVLPATRISVQGGIGTAEEHNFLLDFYGVDAAGWGSPFLLVPEATNIDDETLRGLVTAEPSDFYLSDASPLGVRFNNFRKSGAEKLRRDRIERGRPGSPCTKKYLVSNTEFTAQPICTASREYQKLKIEQLEELALPEEEFKLQFDKITEKICLCEGLCSSAYSKYGILKPRESKAAAICPGPNLAHFSGVFTLAQMVKHIYGELNLIAANSRPHMFVNELNLYFDYLQKEVQSAAGSFNEKKGKQLNKFAEQLRLGLDYYKGILPQMAKSFPDRVNKMRADLQEVEVKLVALASEARELLGRTLNKQAAGSAG